MPHLFQLLGAPGKHCHSLAGSCIAPISASIITQPSLHVLLCLTGLGAYPNSYDRILTLILLRLQRPYFQLRSHSEVLSFHEFGEKALYIPHRQHLSPEGILMTCTILGPRLGHHDRHLLIFLLHRGISWVETMSEKVLSKCV